MQEVQEVQVGDGGRAEGVEFRSEGPQRREQGGGCGADRSQTASIATSERPRRGSGRSGGAAGGARGRAR
ncbi:hypothetical protein [Herbidospora cretacea]|uniref:hypothetical protein n=1 Tax=Herbidospora cretacea TaxID=28444 RepID=UPI0012DD9668|nr:hypothetical protein [Herbidospora cretacea]